ncbi:MAG: cyclodeaminase/cyclohydrolase family protein [Actinomycetota bacterium]|nr:cyclodeaminase/cyclohydrolase family protein [Actinomycetota bacterium]
MSTTRGGRPADDYLEDTLGIFLDRLASGSPAPGGGAAAAVAVAMAAALAGMAARFAEEHLDDSPGLIARADSLRRSVAPLAQADARAYADVLAALDLPREPDPETRRSAIGSALSSAADIPLAVAEIAAEVADLAANLAARGNPNLRGDAIAAGLLADAGARTASVLVKINLGDSSDGRSSRAEKLAKSTTRAAQAGSRTTPNRRLSR